MPRRLAILDDNDRLLVRRLAELRRDIPAAVGDRICAAMVIGSVAEGRARDESDLDLLLVLRAGAPRRDDYRWWDTHVAPRLGSTSRFPVSATFIGRDALATSEPNLRGALDAGIVLWDPEGVFGDESQPRA